MNVTITTIVQKMKCAITVNTALLHSCLVNGAINMMISAEKALPAITAQRIACSMNANTSTNVMEKIHSATSVNAEPGMVGLETPVMKTLIVIITSFVIRMPVNAGMFSVVLTLIVKMMLFKHFVNSVLVITMVTKVIGATQMMNAMENYTVIWNITNAGKEKNAIMLANLMNVLMKMHSVHSGSVCDEIGLDDFKLRNS